MNTFRTVTVYREKLLEVILKNREEHQQVFTEALGGFHEELVDTLAEMLEEAKDAKPGDEVETEVGLTKPTHHLNDYDRVIAMLQLSVDEKVKLTQREFAQYVMDDWTWQEHWLVSNSTWSGTARRKAAIYTMGSPNPRSFSATEVVAD